MRKEYTIQLEISGPTAMWTRPDTGDWQPFPVEYKRGTMKHELGYEVQLCAQMLCLEEMLHVTMPINAGSLFYGKSQRRQEVFLQTIYGPLRKTRQDNFMP